MLTDPFGTNPLTKRIVGCGIRIHEVIGPGVYESVYGECLECELREEGLPYELQRPVPLVYKGARLRSRFYIDIVVDNTVIVELKAVTTIAEIHRRQVLTHLKLTGLPVGLLFNFNVEVLTAGRLGDSSPPLPSLSSLLRYLRSVTSEKLRYLPRRPPPAPLRYP